MNPVEFLSYFSDRVWLFFLFVFSILCIRYVAVSGVPYLILTGFRDTLSRRKIQIKYPVRPQLIKFSIFWSLSSFMVFSLEAVFYYFLYLNESVSLVTSFEELPFFVHLGEFVLLFLVHDIYFYWMHRVLHHRLLFRHIHIIHHRITNPTPFAAFAFHPVEAFLESVWLLPIILWCPIYLGTLLIFLFFSHLFNVIGHLGYEPFPRSFWGWVTTSTHHNLHHQHVSSNYGLYWIIWDKAFGTLDPRTEAEFLRVTS